MASQNRLSPDLKLTLMINQWKEKTIGKAGKLGKKENGGK